MATHSVRMRVAQLIFCLLCCHASAATPIRCSAHDRAALLNVAADVGPAHQTQSWTGSECCEWEGVNCSAQNRVNSLVLRTTFSDVGNLTEGTINPAICELEMLQTLNLSYGLLQGGIPSCLCNLQTLQSLDLRLNSLRGAVPSCLSKLKCLRLDGNDLDGSVPASVCNLQKLQILSLSFNSIAGRIPPCLSDLQELTYLDLSFNTFVGGIPAALGQLMQLTYLDLSQNSLEGNIPASLFRLPKLEKLRLDGNQLNLSSADDLLSDFCKLSHLEELRLRASAVRGTLPRCFSQLRNLSVLILDGNELTGSIPSEWTNLTQLSTLSLSDNHLQIQELPSWLWTLPFLQNMALRSCNIFSLPPCDLRMDASNCSLQSTGHFQWVDLSANPIGGRFPPDFLTVINSSSLFYLNLSRTQLSGSITSAIRGLMNVQLLDLSVNRLSGTIPAKLWNMSNLWYLDLSENVLTGSLPASLAINFDYLDLSLNQLSGTIPSDLWNMSLHLVLDLSENHLTGGLPASPPISMGPYALLLGHNLLEGAIPQSFGQGCFSLSLPGNNLTGPVPRFTGSNYSYLKLLDLSGNRLEGTLQNFRFPDLTSLRVLLLASNRMYRNIADSFHNVTGPLQVIDLSGNQFTGSIPRNLQLPGSPDASDLEVVLTSSGMQLINVVHSKQWQVTIVAKGLVMYYTNLNGLVELNLQDNYLTGTIPDSLSNLSRITYLNLSNNRLTGHIPASLSKLVELESLDLSRNSLTGQIPADLVQLTSLEYLNVSYNHLVGPIPDQNQFLTFDVSSYEGNDGLCSSGDHGILNRCTPSVQPPPLQTARQPSTSNFKKFIGNWTLILVSYVVSLIVHLWVLNRLLKRFFPMLYE